MLVDQANQLEQYRCADALWRGVVETLTNAGLDQVIYLTVSSDFKGPALLCTIPGLYDDLPAERDPFLRHSCNSYDTIPAGLAYLDSHPYVNDAETKVVERAAKAGLNAGIGIPVRLKSSDRFGGFILGNKMSKAEFDAEFMPRSEDLRLFCHLIHRRFEELATESALTLPCAFDVLSPRELEIVLLLARGSSRQQAAATCGISVHTVSDYAKTAYRKLGVNNRAQAAALLHAANTATP